MKTRDEITRCRCGNSGSVADGTFYKSAKAGRSWYCVGCTKRKENARAAARKNRTKKAIKAARPETAWCSWHKCMHSASAFGPCASRANGLQTTCRSGRKERVQSARD